MAACCRCRKQRPCKACPCVNSCHGGKLSAAQALRVLITPDSYGGALDSVGVARAIAAGWTRIRPTDAILIRPMADGGEGTLAAVREALGEGAETRTVTTTDALGRSVSADFLLLDEGRGAFIEMAAASGLARLASE